jgi:hypothetical protein
MIMITLMIMVTATTGTAITTISARWAGSG